MGETGTSLALMLGAVALIAYLLGAIPFTLIIGKVFYNIDPRKVGSGNLGATNSLRVLGWKAGVAVAILDVLKSVLALYIAKYLFSSPELLTYQSWAMVVAALCAILGHAFSPYIGFKGGKGVATAAGAMIALSPKIFLILLVVFVTTIAISRYVSLGSITVAALYPFVTYLMHSGDLPRLLFSIITAVLVIYFHRSNIARLKAGTENKLSFKKKEQ